MPDSAVCTRKGFNVRRVNAYELTDAASVEWRVVFDPVDLPDFSHRVKILKRQAGGLTLVETDWLSSNFRPNGANAVYFATKHGALAPNS